MELDQICFYIPLKPMSFNKSHCINRGKFQYTWEANRFKSNVRKHLYQEWENVQTFTKKLREGQPLFLKYIFWIPSKKLITKSGRISKISLDVDNQIKLLQDSIFSQLQKINPKLDDSQIMRIDAEKRESSNDKYGMTIFIQKKA